MAAAQRALTGRSRPGWPDRTARLASIAGQAFDVRRPAQLAAVLSG